MRKENMHKAKIGNCYQPKPYRVVGIMCIAYHLARFLNVLGRNSDRKKKVEELNLKKRVDKYDNNRF